MLSDLIKSVLVVVVAFLLKLALSAIGVEIDPVLFNTIVASIVTALLALMGYEGVKARVNRSRPGLLK
jgi:uncharacterized protein YacL